MSSGRSKEGRSHKITYSTGIQIISGLKSQTLSRPKNPLSEVSLPETPAQKIPNSQVPLPVPLLRQVPMQPQQQSLIPPTGMQIPRQRSEISMQTRYKIPIHRVPILSLPPPIQPVLCKAVSVKHYFL